MQLSVLEKPFALCVGISLICFQSEAQWTLGIEGGSNKNYLVTNNANRAFTNYLPLTGFLAGATVQYRFSDWLAVAADPSFTQKNYRQERSAFFAGVYQDNYNNYLQLPLTARVIFGGKKISGFIDAGIYGAYWISGKIKGVNPNILDPAADNSSTNSVFDYQKPFSYNEKYSFDNKKDNRYEFGWVAGAGIVYSEGPRMQFFIEPKLFYGFTDQQKQYMINQVPRYNSTYGIYSGIRYHLEKKRKQK